MVEMSSSKHEKDNYRYLAKMQTFGIFPKHTDRIRIAQGFEDSKALNS
jgi:hypothetical protein